MFSDTLHRALIDLVRTLTTDYTATIGLDGLMDVMPTELGIDGAGIMLCDDDDELRFVSASDDVVRLIEGFQVETHEGPCVMAARTGQRTLAHDLREGDPRFPEFARRAFDAGLIAVYSFPMIVEGRSFGAMNLYSRTPGPLGEDALETGQLVADMCAVYLFAARRADDATFMLDRLRSSMDRNAPIEWAKGYLALTLGTTVEEAYEKIRTYARTNNLRSLEVAERVMQRSLTPRDLA